MKAAPRMLHRDRSNLFMLVGTKKAIKSNRLYPQLGRMPELGKQFQNPSGEMKWLLLCHLHGATKVRHFGFFLTNSAIMSSGISIICPLRLHFPQAGQQAFLRPVPSSASQAPFTLPPTPPSTPILVDDNIPLPALKGICATPPCIVQVLPPIKRY